MLQPTSCSGHSDKTLQGNGSRFVAKQALHQLRLCRPEQLAQGEVGSIQQQQEKQRQRRSALLGETKQKAELIPSLAKGFALWAVESSSFYEVYLPPIPTPHIIVHREGGGHIHKMLTDREEVYSVKKHSVSIVPPYTPAYVACSGTVSTLHLTLPMDHIQRTLRSLGIAVDPRLRLEARSNHDDDVAAHLMMAIASYAKRGRERALTSINQGLIFHLFEEYGVIDDVESNAAIDNLQLKRIDEFMLSQLGESLDVDTVADMLQLSATSFSRQFKATTGLTPIGYYRKLRMQRARELIATSRLSLTDIAMDLGFTDAAHFSKSFHKHWGFPPSKLRTCS